MPPMATSTSVCRLLASRPEQGCAGRADNGGCACPPSHTTRSRGESGPHGVDLATHLLQRTAGLMCHTRGMRLVQRVSAQQLGGLVLRVLGSGLSVCHDVSSLAHQVLVDRGVIPLARTACHRAGLPDVEHFSQWGSGAALGCREAPQKHHVHDAIQTRLIRAAMP